MSCTRRNFIAVNNSPHICTLYIIPSRRHVVALLVAAQELKARRLRDAVLLQGYHLTVVASKYVSNALALSCLVKFYTRRKPCIRIHRYHGITRQLKGPRA